MKDIQISNLSFSYNGAGALILENINMKVRAGEFVCILGQSGCGKSTFLRLLAGLEKPTGGEIKIGDQTVERAGLERGVVFQDYGLFPWMTAGENVLLALKQKYPDKKKAELKRMALSAIRDVGLKEDVYQKLPKELSGGMKQRCAIARSFSLNPPILLMDEPFGALDAVTRAKLQELVLGLWKKDSVRRTIFFVTHDVDEALLLGTKICVLGQSPSHIIYECSTEASRKPDRSAMYEDADIMKLRNTLIRHINQDVSRRME